MQGKWLDAGQVVRCRAGGTLFGHIGRGGKRGGIGRNFPESIMVGRNFFSN
jgi:hypothetical protein